MLTKEELPACPVATTVQLIGSKWKLLILRNLLQRPWRFNELRRDLEEAFASAAEHGETEQQVIRRLGTPEEFAASAAESFGVGRGTPGGGPGSVPRSSPPSSPSLPFPSMPPRGRAACRRAPSGRPTPRRRFR